jgi:DNA-binding NarL/FixJ family response regulator
VNPADHNVKNSPGALGLPHKSNILRIAKMVQDINVVIVEDDPFARNWMVLMGVRDWRTRVVGEVDEPSKLLPILKDKTAHADFIIIDTDIPGGENWISRILETVASLNQIPKILCTGLRPNAEVLRQLSHPAFVGYILKDEIRYSLAWAISMAIDGKWVITDGVQALAYSIGFQLPKSCLVLDGRNVIGQLDERKANVARLAFLFSIERKELADELGVGKDWGYQLVSEVYEELGIKDVLEDEEILQNYFGDYELIMSYIKKIKKSRRGLKSKDMETLAFHMITMPEMSELK